VKRRRRGAVAACEHCGRGRLAAALAEFGCDLRVIGADVQMPARMRRRFCSNGCAAAVVPAYQTYQRIALVVAGVSLSVTDVARLTGLSRAGIAYRLRQDPPPHVLVGTARVWREWRRQKAQKAASTEPARAKAAA